MSAAEALKAARTAGVHVEIDGEDLYLTATAAPPAVVLALLARFKEGVIALLRKNTDCWSGEDWLAFFDERAGIAEFDGGLSREEAEAYAFDRTVIEWLNRNPARSAPGLCFGCGEDKQEPVIPFGTDPRGQVWLHPQCWTAWQDGRQAEAIAALKRMGIEKPGIDQ